MRHGQTLGNVILYTFADSQCLWLWSTVEW